MLVEVRNSHPVNQKETILQVERAQQIEKLGDCPALGSCKKSGCKDPCDLRQGQKYCKAHRNAAYAEKTVPRINGGGGADKHSAALWKSQQKKLSQKIARAMKAEESEPSEGKEKVDKAQEDRLKKHELTRVLCERQLSNNADAKENYVTGDLLRIIVLV